MAQAMDVNAMMKDMMGAFRMDNTQFNGAFKTTAALNEKLAQVAIDAFGKSTELSNKWTRETLNKLSVVTTAKEEPAEYAKAFGEFASAQAEIAAENLAAFAEIAKSAQTETVEVMMTAGQDYSEQATSAAKKAGEEATAATKRAATVNK